MIEDLEFTWEDGEPDLTGLGDRVSLAQLLLILSDGDTAQAEDVLDAMEERGIALDVGDYEAPNRSGATGNRLAMEAELVRGNKLPQDDVLAMTLAEYGAAPALDRARGQELWERTGDEKAKTLLAEGSLPFVRDLALSFVGKGVLLQDLLQEGSLALWEFIAAQNSGDYWAGLETAVGRALSRAVALQAVQDKAGTALGRDMKAYGKAALALQKCLGRTPSNGELAAELHKTPEETAALARLIRESRRAMEKKPPEKDSDAEKPVEDSAYFALRTRVEELLSNLDEKSRGILTLRFGLDGKPARSTEEIMEETGLTEEAVLRLEGEALAALRDKESGN